MPLKNQHSITQQLERYLVLQTIPVESLKLSRGFCIGYALCRAAMRVTGKLAWWDALIEQIVSWDGEESSLQTIVSLPDSDDRSPVSLQTLFERFIHYIVFNQSCSSRFDKLELHSETFLLPGDHFELLQSNNILRVKHNFRMAGHFLFEHLVESLGDITTIQAITDNICLVISEDHGCELSYIDGCWHFYDPNYPSGEARIFDSLSDLVEEILRVQGHTMCIEIASFHDLTIEPFEYYNKVLLLQYPEQLMQGKGLAQICRFTPHLVSPLLNQIKTQNKIPLLDLEQTDLHGMTPLLHATERQCISAIQALCEAGAKPDKATSSGWAPLFTAVEKGHVAAIKMLCNTGINPNDAKLINGYTPMIIALNNGHTDVVEALCIAGSDPNQLLLPNGLTPLRFATEQGDFKVIWQ